MLWGEQLFYRVDLTTAADLSEFFSQVTREALPEFDNGVRIRVRLALVDRSNEVIRVNNRTRASDAVDRANQVGIVAPDVGLPEGLEEVYLRIQVAENARDVENPIEILTEVAVDDAPQEETEEPVEPEPESESPVDEETEEPQETEAPAEEPDVEETEGELVASVSSGTPGWVIGGFVALALIILVLGAVVVVLLRRTAGPRTR